MTADGVERVQLPIPATEFLAQRRAVVVGVNQDGGWSPTSEQLAYAAGKLDTLYPTERTLAEVQARGY